MSIDAKDIIIVVSSAFGMGIVYFIKDILRTLKELKQFDIDNKDKIKDNFFLVSTSKDSINENKEKINEHEKRIDEHDKKLISVHEKLQSTNEQVKENSKQIKKNENNVNTIVATHNTTCGKLNKIKPVN